MRRLLIGSVVRRLPALAAAGLALFVVLGFGGVWHPAFDTMAQFRAHAGVALGLLAILLLAQRRVGAGLGSLAAAGLSAVSVVPFLVPAASRPAPENAPRYTLLQMNLRFDAPDHAAALRLIAAKRPDIITAQELTPQWAREFETLRDAYPYQYYCRKPFWHGDAAILSRRPFAASGPGAVEICEPRNSFAARSVDFNGLALTVVSQHLRWPWPGRQSSMVADLQPTLASLRDPILIAGDFNSAPWTASVAAYARASGTRVLAGIGPSWMEEHLPPALARFVGLPIDNVLVSEGVEVLSVETLPPTTSDHLPILVSFTLRFAPTGEPDARTAQAPAHIVP